MTRFLLAVILLASLTGALPCRGEDDPAAAAREATARRAAVAAMRRERRLTNMLSQLAAEYQRSGDVRIAIEMQVLALTYARECPDTPLGRFLRVGPLP